MSKGSNTLNQQTAKPSRSVLFGAAFLMATSAIGPGFLTQTSKFTAQFGTALSLVIVLAIIMDITAQMNIWSVVSVSGMRAQDVANKLLPGLGVVIAILVAIGGLAFNVGNVGGVALGFNAIGLNEKIGAVIAGCLGIIIFVNKNAKTIMDKVATVLAAVILLTVATVAVISKPPVGEAVSSLAQLGNAAALLIIAGAFNGLILPVTLGVMLIAGHNKRIVGESYHHPLWMTVLGAVVTLVALYAGIKAVPGIMQLFQ